MPRKRDIEAAITAYNSTSERTVLLPPDAARLLAIMFPRSTVFRGSAASLVAQGFDDRTVRLLLRALVETGFVPKESVRYGVTPTYHLHLPPQRRL